MRVLALVAAAAAAIVAVILRGRWLQGEAEGQSAEVEGVRDLAHDCGAEPWVSDPYPARTTVLVHVLSQCDEFAPVGIRVGREGAWRDITEQDPEREHFDNVHPKFGETFAFTVEAGERVEVRCPEGFGGGTRCTFRLVEFTAEPAPRADLYRPRGEDRPAPCGRHVPGRVFNLSETALGIRVSFLSVCGRGDGEQPILTSRARNQGGSSRMPLGPDPAKRGGRWEWTGTLDPGRMLEVQCPGEGRNCAFSVHLVPR